MVNNKAQELRDTCWELRKYSGICPTELYLDSLIEYETCVGELLLQNDPYPWEEYIELEDKYKSIEKVLQSTSDRGFLVYVFLGDILAVIKKCLSED